MQKQEAVANLRQQLWREFNEEYIDREKLSSAARKIRAYLPDDFFATFCELACGRDQKKLNAFLNQIDVAAHGGYIADVVRFMLKIVRRANLLALNDLLERGRAALGQDFYNKYYPVLARESEKLDEEVYNPSLPRDAFILYSSADMPAVSELVDALEGEGLKCFVAARNIRHGFASDYENILRRAIDSCKVAVFVSTSHSRSTECDALKVEMEYIRKQDVAGAPAEARADYAKLPRKYKKPRVEYVAEAYSGKEIERVMKELFAGFERSNSVRDVVRQVIELERDAGEGAKNSIQGGKTVRKAPAREGYPDNSRGKKPAGGTPAEERAENGEAERAYHEGCMRNREGNFAAGIPLLKEAADLGCAAAQYELGLCYRDGIGVARSRDGGMSWFQMSAAQGYAPAQKVIGDHKLDRAERCNFLEYSLREDCNKAAVEWYRKAAGQGYAPAQCSLGYCYFFGDGVPSITKVARKYFLSAAKQGYAPAQYNYARVYAWGHSIIIRPLYIARLRKWYRRAAEQGLYEAQSMLDLIRSGIINPSFDDLPLLRG